jgi:phage terminase large subunit-like protein
MSEQRIPVKITTATTDARVIKAFEILESNLPIFGSPDDAITRSPDRRPMILWHQTN